MFPCWLEPTRPCPSSVRIVSAIPDSTLPGHRELHERVIGALQLCQESRDVEFKGPIPWPCVQYKIVKSSLAMANLRDGGVIIIGVTEQGPNWILEGLNDETLLTYNEDDLNDFINRYASPTVRVELIKVTYQQKLFLAIRVPEFETTPVVCKRDFQAEGLRRGAVYVRPIGKPQTSQVNEAPDMEHLLELASEKRARRLLETAARVGLRREPSDDEAFDRELEGL
jgi:predicted HTH transcriptional regulator